MSQRSLFAVTQTPWSRERTFFCIEFVTFTASDSSVVASVPCTMGSLLECDSKSYVCTGKYVIKASSLCAMFLAGTASKVQINFFKNRADSPLKSSILHRWPRLLSTLTVLLTPLAPLSTLIASSFFLCPLLPQFPPLLLLLLLLGSPPEIQEFSLSNLRVDGPYLLQVNLKHTHIHAHVCGGGKN